MNWLHRRIPALTKLPVHVLITNLRDEDANNNAQLVQCSQGASQRCWGDLTHIHGYKTRGQPRVKADHKTTNDKQFPGTGHLWKPHQSSCDEDQNIGSEHRILPEDDGKKVVKPGPLGYFYSLIDFVYYFYLPRRLTKSPTENEPKIPPTGNIETDKEKMPVSEPLVMVSL